MGGCGGCGWLRERKRSLVAIAVSVVISWYVHAYVLVTTRMSARALLVVALAVAATSSAFSTGKRCTSNLDCSLLGQCQPDGSCQCKAGWTGDSCARANLLPLNVSLGYQNQTAASWGGRALQVSASCHQRASQTTAWSFELGGHGRWVCVKRHRRGEEGRSIFCFHRSRTGCRAWALSVTLLLHQDKNGDWQLMVTEIAMKCPLILFQYVASGRHHVLVSLCVRATFPLLGTTTIG